MTCALATGFAPLIDRDSPISHYDLDQAFRRFDVSAADPRREDANAGKEKRVKAVLHWSVQSDPKRGGELFVYLLEQLRGHGQFVDEPNRRTPTHLVENLRSVLVREGLSLADDGSLAPVSLDGLAGRDLTDALKVYVGRARRGEGDGPLMAGNAKDLVEATARHVLVERYGDYNEHLDFRGTLHVAFEALDMGTLDPKACDDLLAGLDPDRIRALHQAVYLLAVVVNRLRNAEGTGHGRPHTAELGAIDGRLAREATGLVAGVLLDRI